MPMVSTEFGIGAVEGGVAMGFWFLDSIDFLNVKSLHSEETVSSTQGL